MSELKTNAVEMLTTGINTYNDLYRDSRAHYLELVATQRSALAAKLDLIEVRKRQYIALSNLYKVLGGGWR